MKSNSNYDVIIVGAGPAGMSAAIYLLRAGVNCLLLEFSSPGGNLNKTHMIDNYPGFVDHDGTTLAFNMYNQLTKLKANLKIEKVKNINYYNEQIMVETNKECYTSEFLILASGRIPRKLEIEDIDKFLNKGISYCATCDGALYKDKSIAVVGGGNTAMETARYMSNLAKKIYVINRSSALRATKKDQEEIMMKKNVEILYNSKIKKIISNEEGITGIELDDKKKLNIQGIFVCIGYEANDEYYKTLSLKRDSLGLIVNDNMQTSNEKIFACGDIISKSLYQVVTATSEGAIAANTIIEKLNKK